MGTQGRRDWGSISVSMGIVLLGLGILAGLVYADLTTTVTRADYETFQAGCDDLDGQTRLVDGGLGMEPVELNETHVQQCRNTSYTEYRQGRIQAMDSAPLNARQWVLYGGAGLAFTLGGSVLLRQELFPER